MRRLAALGLFCALAAVVALAQVSVGGGTPGGGASSGGASFWNGTVAPTNIVGGNGDFYLNTSTYCLYGPKAAGTWPAACVSLIGQSGIPGPPLGYVAENTANKGTASGYAPLNSTAQVPMINLPIIPYTQISGVQLALGFTPLNPVNNLGDLSNAAAARSNLGLVIGTNVEPHSALLDGFAGLAVNGIVAVSGSSASSGTLSGDVSTNGLAATVNSVGGSTAASLHSAEMLANAATSNNINSTIVMRDHSGNINAAQVYAGGTAVENTANKGAANGYAPLDSTGLLPAANLPANGSFTGKVSTSATGAGAFMMTAGAGQTPPPNTVGLQAPPSVPTSFNCTWWGVPVSGVVHATATAPCILSPSLVQLTDLDPSTLPAVDISGSYTDLLNQPTIPAPLGFTPVNVTSVGVANGVAPLDATGLLPIANLPNPIVTAGVGGVTAGYLVARDTSNPTRYVATSAGACGTGFAASTGAAGATFQLYSMPGTLIAAIADNTVTAGDIVIGGSVIPGRVADSGFSSRSSIPATTCIVGIAQASAAAGGTFEVLFDGVGSYGTLANFTSASTGAVTRTQQAKSSDTLSVMDFGATGNGTSDDRPAVQAAITAACANGGGTVYFPDGTYLMNSYQSAGAASAVLGTWANLRITCNNVALQLNAHASLIQSATGGLGPLTGGSGGTFLFAIGYDLTTESAENATHYAINPTTANQSTITTTTASQAANFVAGDDIMIWIANGSYPCSAEMAKIVSANAGTGVITLDRPLLQSYGASPVAADVAAYQVSGITINGGILSATYLFGILQVKNLQLSNLSATVTTVGTNASGIFSANYVQSALFDHLNIQANGYFVELPQRASNNIEIRGSTFLQAAGFAFGEWVTAWRIHDNAIYLKSTANSAGYYVGSGGLDVEWRHNTIRIPAGSLSEGMLDYTRILSGDFPGLNGETRIVDNTIDCTGFVGNCLTIYGPDTKVQGNTLRGNVYVASPGSSLTQHSGILGNQIDTSWTPFSTEAASCITLNSPTADGVTVTGNSCTGAGTAGSIGINITGQVGGDTGAHVVTGNSISGYATPIAYSNATNPGTQICCNPGATLLTNILPASLAIASLTASGDSSITSNSGPEALIVADGGSGSGYRPVLQVTGTSADNAADFYNSTSGKHWYLDFSATGSSFGSGALTFYDYTDSFRALTLTNTGVYTFGTLTIGGAQTVTGASSNTVGVVGSGGAVTYEAVPTAALASTTVTPGTYGGTSEAVQFTVNQAGQITAASQTGQTGLNTVKETIPTVDCLCAHGGDASVIVNSAVQLAYVPAGAPGGSGYTNGDTWTGSGGTCTTEPAGILTVSGGAITALSVATQGVCTVFPTGITTVDGGSGALMAFSSCNNTSDDTGAMAFNSTYSIPGGSLAVGSRFLLTAEMAMYSSSTAETFHAAPYLLYGTTQLIGYVNSPTVPASLNPANYEMNFNVTFSAVGGSGQARSNIAFVGMPGWSTAIYNSLGLRPVSTTGTATLNLPMYYNAHGVASGTYTSGPAVTGAAGTTCLLTAFNGATGSGATAAVYLTGTNAIASGTPIYITATGQGYTTVSTSATQGSGTATCTAGSAVITTALGGAQGNMTDLQILTVIQQH